MLDIPLNIDKCVVYKDFFHQLYVIHAYLYSNPDQSKHLETARMHIYDTWIDFVNLRSETYVENSRIPTMVQILSFTKFY